MGVGRPINEGRPADDKISVSPQDQPGELYNPSRDDDLSHAPIAPESFAQPHPP